MPGADDYRSADAFSTGNPAGFMAYHVRIGSSAREARQDYRDLGGTTGDTAWNKMYGQVADTLARIPDQAALDPGALPSAADYGTWAMGPGNQYATQVNVQMVDLDTGLYSLQPYTYVSNFAHTPEEAEAAAMADFAHEDDPGRYPLQAIGAFTIHLWQTEPFRSLGTG